MQLKQHRADNPAVQAVVHAALERLSNLQTLRQYREFTELERERTELGIAMEEAVHEIAELRRDNRMLATQLAVSAVRNSARAAAM